MMLFLNPEWHYRWGGCLELWNRDLSERVHTILPLMNRMVLFRTSDTSFHGHPVPLNVPEGVTRKSLAVYYYEDWPAGVKVRNHTNYVETAQ
jgi:Rps23 Pro-64 3,4-dihydroxylase Tpa1-like proline 4-hydroxylase